MEEEGLGKLLAPSPRKKMMSRWCRSPASSSGRPPAKLRRGWGLQWRRAMGAPPWLLGKGMRESVFGEVEWERERTEGSARVGEVA